MAWSLTDAQPNELPDYKDLQIELQMQELRGSFD